VKDEHNHEWHVLADVVLVAAGAITAILFLIGVACVVV